jgi:hypothetical protein
MNRRELKMATPKMIEYRLSLTSSCPRRAESAAVSISWDIDTFFCHR